MPDDNMPLIYRHCLYHIDSIDPLNLSNMLFDHDGGRQWICSRSLPKPLTIETIDTPVIDAPIIFQVIGQISRRKNLVRIRNPAGDMVKAVIWVECRDDRASRALWARIPRSLTLVSVAAESYLSHSKAFEIDPDSGIMRMRIVWSPNEGVDNKEVPAFIGGDRVEIGALQHGQAVTVLFNLVHGAPAHNKAYLEVSMISVAPV
ncbi:hypothetical protein FIBSPDRAFT_962179 [Athelia psychrophila]|uniref:Uncharacterized protein n=1 Tax=Athelia psychrophila TaxID=1759441 RepID=A0A166AEE1_9AGAM|nr:hypothetical protein FIBSPDRAFT_962179 [Fibularhizoctonia sp. CBS 109695]